MYVCVRAHMCMYLHACVACVHICVVLLHANILVHMCNMCARDLCGHMWFCAYIHVSACTRVWVCEYSFYSLLLSPGRALGSWQDQAGSGTTTMASVTQHLREV